MDEQTALVLALQLVALFSIAGALLLYLLCKIRPGYDDLLQHSDNTPGAGRAVLITSADNALGLQVSLHLADRGFRVFVGLKNGVDPEGVACRVIRAWQKARESLTPVPSGGALIPLPFDITREDLLHEALSIIGAHLPAGNDGIWAVMNTTSTIHRARLDRQEIGHWDAMLKTNIVGVLRLARRFHPLLKKTGGRLLNFGPSTNYGSGSVAYVASKFGADGACRALREEFAASGVKVINLQPETILPELFCVAPKMKKNDDGTDISINIEGHLEYEPIILNRDALNTLEIALTVTKPRDTYALTSKRPWLKMLDSFVI